MGNQVVFSSINYGTDTSEEGRMVIKSLLKATNEGLGRGETPIFPVQIFKVKEGINFSDKDFDLATSNMSKALKEELKYETPNFDLFVLACQTSAKRLFPNFAFLDSSFNKHNDWDITNPKNYENEVSYMGCRTRVFDNRHGQRTVSRRGNISFTSINLVRLAILARREAEYVHTDEKLIQEYAIKRYKEKLDDLCDLGIRQLHDRYEFQATAKAKQFPFLMGQGLWQDGENLKPSDRIESVIKHGTLSLGYIGLAEALKMLIGKHHGESEEAQKLGLEIVKQIRTRCDEASDKYDLNYSCLATPAEGLSGRFTKIDRKEFGIIPEITDREFYTNSNHVPVYFNIPAHKKIEIESPYHKLSNAGHILYVEIDAEAKKNLLAFMTLVKDMKDNDAGYGSVNHPIDRCNVCEYNGVIETSCPICGEKEKISKIRRITGYLVGSTEKWNSSKKAEEKARTKHKI